MTITDGRRAIWERFRVAVSPNIPYLHRRAHLPCVEPDIIDKYSAEEWNEILEFLACAADKQPFGDPYFWQTHEKNDFVRWLRSWKV